MSNFQICNAMELTASASGEDLNCMEVCGGRGDIFSYYQRPGLDVWVLSRVKQNATAGGGELHLISSCASGRITRMLMADICGFGPLFNDLAARLREVIKKSVNTIKQGRPVRRMSEELEEAAQHGGSASTLMSTYFAPARAFTLCNAGHPPPMLYRRRTREWSILKQPPSYRPESDIALGMVAPGEYQHLKTTLKIGDMVLSCGNSLTESRDGDGRIIGHDGLLNRLDQLDTDRPTAIPQQLVDGIRNEHAENLSADDATVVLCRATETPVPWRDNVLAPLRLLRSVTDRTSIS